MLTAKRVQSERPPTDRNFKKLTDEKGLYLHVTRKGQKYWRMGYRFGGKQKVLALGVYPEVSLSDARAARDDARALLRRDLDPSALRKARKLSRTEAHSFEEIGREWVEKQRESWAASHTSKVLGRLEREAFPHLGRLAPDEISAPSLLGVLRRIEDRGHNETAHRTLQAVSSVLRYAITTGRAERNAAADLRGALRPVKPKHFASITDPGKVGTLLRAIDGYGGTFVVGCALKLAPLLFVRPGELRHADWSEIDMDSDEPCWRIPANRMKMESAHIVPLCTQAIEILESLHSVTGPTGFVFPAAGRKGRPMSENTVNSALRALGYDKSQMTGHGFRSMASTLLNELGWNPDAIERQLAHAERNKVRAAYNYADYLSERRRMMQGWADYLDKLKGTSTRHERDTEAKLA